jgi:hypothetical protein
VLHNDDTTVKILELMGERCRGHGLDGWQPKLVEAKGRGSTPKGKRDLALIRLLHDQGWKPSGSDSRVQSARTPPPGHHQALDMAGGDVRKVRRFRRHAKLDTLLR